MQLYDRVTSAKSTPHNRDYVACSAFPRNGIVGKIKEPWEVLGEGEPMDEPESAKKSGVGIWQAEVSLRSYPSGD